MPEQNAEEFLAAEQPTAEEFLKTEQPSAVAFLSEGGSEPRSTAEKAQFSAAHGLVSTLANVVRTDIGPAKNTFSRFRRAQQIASSDYESDIDPLTLQPRGLAPLDKALSRLDAAHEERRQFFRSAQGLDELAKNTGVVAEAIPGNETVAKTAGMVGSAVPFILSGPAAPAVAGLAASGETERAAYDAYRAQGLSDEEAYARSQADAGRAGVTSAATFMVVPKVLEPLKRLLPTAAAPLLQALTRTGVAAGEGATVMGADTAARLVQEKMTYNPDLTFDQALKQVGYSAGGGAVLSALLHAPMEIPAAVRARLPAAPEPAKPETPETVSEFGGAVAAPPATMETTATERPADVFDEVAPPEQPAAVAPIEEAAPAAEVPAVEASAPLSTTERKYLAESLTAREPLPAEQVARAQAEGGFALPEGYAQEGDKFVFTEPAKPETDAARMAREQREAMARLRQNPIEPAAPAAPSPSNPTPRVEAGVPMQTFERPPDILDWIQDNIGSGVRIPEGKDFDWVRSAVKELSQSKAGDLSGTKLKRLFNGRTDATDVVSSANDARAFGGAENTDALFEKMIAAAKSRVEWAKQEKAASKFKPPAEAVAADVDPWQETIDHLNSLKIDTRGQLHAFGLLPEAWNTLIDIAALGVKGGRAIGDAVDWALNEFRTRFPDAKFDLAGARQWLTDNLSKPQLTKVDRDLRKFQATVNLFQSYRKAGVDNLAAAAKQFGAPADRALEHAWAIASGTAEPVMTLDQLPAGARQDLMKLPVRQTAARLATAGTLSDDVMAKLQPITYEPQSQETWRKGAAAIRAEAGMNGAIDTVLNWPSTLPPEWRGALAELLHSELAGIERNPTTGAATRDLAIKRQVEIMDAMISNFSDIGTQLNSAQLLGETSPEALVKLFEQKLGDIARVDYQSLRGHVRNVINAIKGAVQDAAAGIRQDPAANTAAREAVDAEIAGNAETHKAVVMELAEPWASSPEILNMAREKVRAKANELLNVDPRPPGLTPAQHLRKIMDDLATRAAGIAASYFQGQAVHKDGLIGLYKERLGLDEAHATRLAKQMDTEFARQVEAAKKKLPKRIATQRARRQATAALETDSAVDQAIRSQLQKHNLKLGELLAKHTAEIDATSRTIGEKIVEEAGLTGDAAGKLKDVINRRFVDLVEKGKAKRLDKLLLAPKVERTLKKKSVTEKLNELVNLGAFDDGKFEAALKEKLGLPELSDAQKREIVRRSNEIQTTPRGIERDFKVHDLQKWMVQQAGIPWYRWPMAFWYAHLFSSLAHVGNLLGNTAMLPATIGFHLANDPRGFVDTLRAGGRGLREGALDAASILRTGAVTGAKLHKQEPTRELETLGKWALPWKLVGRAMSAEDTPFYRVGQEMRDTAMARMVSSKEGLTGGARDRRVAEILGQTKERRAVAQAQAQSEGQQPRGTFAQKIEYRRRVDEIMRQDREELFGELGREYGRHVTMNADPGNTLFGYMAQYASQLSQKPGFRWLSLIAPVIRVPANLSDFALDFGPTGMARLANYKFGSGRIRGKEVTDPLAGRELAFRALGSSLALIGAGMYFGRNLDDDKKPQLFGAGPQDAGRRKILKQTGHIDHSIRVGGRYYTLNAFGPLMPWLDAIGNYLDAQRYGELDKSDAANRMVYATKQMPRAMLDQSFLTGISQVLNWVDDNSTTHAGKAPARIVGNIAGNFIPFSQALRTLDKWNDPQVYTSDTVAGQLMLQTPYVRRNGQPALNRFGQPLTARPDQRFWSDWKPDPIVSLLLDKKALPGDLSRGELTEDEYYLLVRRAGPMFYREIISNAGKIATMRPREAKAEVERLQTKTTQSAKEALNLDTIERLRRAAADLE